MPAIGLKDASDINSVKTASGSRPTSLLHRHVFISSKISGAIGANPISLVPYSTTGLDSSGCKSESSYYSFNGWCNLPIVCDWYKHTYMIRAITGFLNGQ
jgi:hypothetical protein